MKRNILIPSLAVALSAGLVLLSGATALADFKYTVKKGDNLWKIAKEYLGDGALYTRIYEANKDIIKDPDVIRIGWELVIPGGDAAAGDVEESSPATGETAPVPTETVDPKTLEEAAPDCAGDGNMVSNCDIPKVISYEGDGGWRISYNRDKFSLEGTVANGEITFNYTGESSGPTAVSISYHPGKMPDEVLYEKVADIDDSRITRGESMFAGYWAHYRHISPENEDPEAGDVVYSGYTAIEHNGGTILICSTDHFEINEAWYNDIMQATSQLLESFELVNHEPQAEYAYIPGKYVRHYSEEMEGEMLPCQDIVELNEDHSCSLTFQDTVNGEWTGTKIILNNGNEYEYTVEGTTLYLNMNGEWLPFEKEQ